MELLQILFFAAIAIFLGVRLYSILGRPQGRSPEEHAREMREKQADIQREQERTETAPIRKTESPLTSFDDYEDAAQDGLMAIAQADPVFNPAVFLKGARSAYEMIVKAYAAGDIKALQPLLSDRVASAYEESIKGRQSREETQITEIERMKSAAITDASLVSGKAKIKVGFIAEIASEVRSKDDEVISGDINTLKTVEEIWTFERSVHSDNPNWVLASVKTV